MVSVMLHIDKAGYMNMLEIIKYDGSPILDPPSPDKLVLLLPEARGQVPGQASPQKNRKT
jgi:hypothetical protein